jgi:arylsulfatase A-like enzyme
MSAVAEAGFRSLRSGCARVRGAAWAALVAVSLACGGPEPIGTRAGRIILITMDTTRADYVSPYAAVEHTPTLRTIAEEGVWLRRFYAASSYTLPAHMSIFTGLDPAQHRVHDWGARLRRGVPTLAELLRSAGYRTFGVHEGGYMVARHGFDRGFQTYEERARKAVLGVGLPEVLGWMREHADEAYFLFLHTYMAHYPYGGFARYRQQHPERGLPPDAWIAEQRRRYRRSARFKGRANRFIPPATRALCTLYNQLASGHAALLRCGDNFFGPEFPESESAHSDLDAVRSSYGERVAAIDRGLARIRGTLEELRQWDDTLLVVTSDHGEAFFEHGHYQHDYVPFNEVLRVPLVISFPRLLRGRGSSVVEQPASHLDLVPTVLGLVGIPAPEGLPGLDLTPVLLGRDELPDDRAVYSAVLRLAHREQMPLRRVVVRGDLKYVEGHARFGDAEGLLFDLESDPGETRNLRGERADVFLGLAELAERWERELGLDPEAARGGSAEDAATPPSEEEIESLRALGYVD